MLLHPSRNQKLYASYEVPTVVGEEADYEPHKYLHAEADCEPDSVKYLHIDFVIFTKNEITCTETSKEC